MALANIFGGIKPDGLPFTIYTMSHSDLDIDPNTFVGSHTGSSVDAACRSTTLLISADQISPADTAAEMVEVYEAAINNGWNCGFTNGEALSRALAGELHPEYAALQPSTMIDWWNHGAHDFISTNNATDGNYDANGCGTLFLGYLHDGLGGDRKPSWEEIVAAGGNTLAETYSKLTLDHADNAFPKFKEALQPFVDGGQLDPPDIGKPWTSPADQQQERKRKIIFEAFGGVGVLFSLAGAAYYYIRWRCRRQERARRDANQNRPIELGELNANIDDPA